MHATIVIDLGYGDAGKGTIVDFLARDNPDTSAVVRFSGGPQAAHNVVTDDGRHHTFAQFGAATLVPGVRTHLSQHMMVNPGNLFREEAHLREIGVHDALTRLSVHPRAMVITPWHQAMNKMRASTLQHGTTGQGIGETMKMFLERGDEWTLRAGDLLNKNTVIEKTKLIKRLLVGEAASLGLNTAPLWDEEMFVTFMEETERLASPPFNVIRDDLAELARDGDLIFEGSQGVLLDQTYGFHPHTTWSTTTRKPALNLLTGLNPESTTTIGVMRTYQTRHGNGPFVTEYLPDNASFSSRVAAQLRVDHREDHNDDSGLAGTFRTGWLDLIATRYAIDCSPVDSIAVTHMDRVGMTVTVCDNYLYGGMMTDIAPYFHGKQNSKVLSRIRMPLYTRTHAHTEAVGTRLRDCKPSLLTVSKDKLVPLLERTMERPVSILSESPTASGKQWISEPRRPEPAFAATASI